MKVEASVIAANERLSAIRKERNARRHGGEHVQWFVTDKHGRLLLSSGKLTALQVLVLRDNQLHGTVPACLAQLPLEMLWLEENNFHGPLPELSVLGQFIKGIASLTVTADHRMLKIHGRFVSKW